MNLRLPDMTPEMRLLLSCCRPSVSEKDDEKIRTFSCSSIDWEVFLKLVDRHRVYPFVYRHLAGSAPGKIPNYVVKGLFDRVEKNTRHALTMTSEFVRIFRLLRQNSIPAIPLKGPVLALQIYEDVGLRHAGDLDLLVAPRHIERTDHILRQNGYKRLIPDFVLSPIQKAIFFRLGQLYTYYHDKRRSEIELHQWWNSDPYLFPLDIEMACKCAQNMDLSDTQVKTLNVNDLLLYLCSHGARHAWVRLFWLCDIATLVRRNPSYNWTRLMARAADLNVGRSLAEGLVMLNLLFGDPIPDAVQAYANKNGAVKKLVNMALKIILLPLGTHRHERAFTHFRNKLYLLKLCSKPRYKLSCLTSLSTSHSDWSAAPLPDVLFPLYFVLRPFLWFWRWFLIHRLHRFSQINER